VELEVEFFVSVEFFETVGDDFAIFTERMTIIKRNNIYFHLKCRKNKKSGILRIDILYISKIIYLKKFYESETKPLKPSIVSAKELARASL